MISDIIRPAYKHQPSDQVSYIPRNPTAHIKKQKKSGHLLNAQVWISSGPTCHHVVGENVPPTVLKSSSLFGHVFPLNYEIAPAYLLVIYWSPWEINNSAVFAIIRFNSKRKLMETMWLVNHDYLWTYLFHLCMFFFFEYLEIKFSYKLDRKS